MPWPLLLPVRKPNKGASRVEASGKSFMFIISNYTINFIGYPDKYRPYEIEAATMGSRLTTRAYYLMILEAGILQVRRTLSMATGEGFSPRTKGKGP